MLGAGRHWLRSWRAQPTAPPAALWTAIMTSGFFPGGQGSPFDEFFARFMGGGGPGAPREGRQRIDITQFLSEQARELINTAARRAAETGSADLDTDHLLWAMAD